MTDNFQPSVQKQALLIILLSAGFLFLKYILQVYPSIITHQLMLDFHLSGLGLGNLAASFYYSYMIMQLIVGILLDKWGTRFLTTGAILCSSIGVIIFSASHSTLIACLSRAMMGAGVAFATVAYMKLAATWFKAKHYAFVGGLLASAAMAGAVFGQAPMAFFIAQMGWRISLLLIGIAGLILCVFFYIIVRDRSDNIAATQELHSVNWNDIFLVLKDKRNWALTFYSGLAFSPIAIFGGLWGTPFLGLAYNLDVPQASALVSLAFIGLGVGSPIIGIISNRLKKRSTIMVICTFLSFLSISLVVYGHGFPLWLIAILLFLFGFCLGAFMLAFTIGKEINNAMLTATVIAMINFSDAFLDAITEPAIGWFLDKQSHGALVNGMHSFSLQSYRYSLTILPCYLLLAIVCLIILRRLCRDNPC